jgi:hypothetical protein
VTTPKEAIRSEGLVQTEPDYDGASRDTFEIPNCESRGMVEEGRITCVFCSDALEYDGADLLGLTVSSIRLRLGQEDQLEGNVGLGEAVYFNQLGLTLFFADGVVRSATCNACMVD